jgi:hypothetical protein
MLLKVLHIPTWSDSLTVFCVSECFMLPSQGFLYHYEVQDSAMWRAMLNCEILHSFILQQFY